ncbi:DUF7311 family protein [Haloarcula argentinensis]|uniref:DUF7311 domain-containing protein n=1 Tax=Haloarcula argentinensis TaxID=43776 RepID=A0A830FP61_HALAR|nr:hypothetical protein [Haloarcula argentinensis]EMA19298.1 hypothetical protein C443_16816 [Haloarcula argentinensis DSM 12282]MDS0254209.1 hypothetical protein [Haloarcula argentinensis]GGM43388.1 hypothetical protein GCM10009006_25830 [Haloarcula argentinensis]
MIYRLVLAVAVTTALVGATAPALSIARADAASGTMERQLDELETELTTLVETDDATANGDARRAVTIRLPVRTYTNAGVSQLQFAERAGVGIATWTVESRKQTERLVGTPIRTTAATDRLDEPGTHRLVFVLTRSNGQRILQVHRFKSEAAARHGHA